MQLLSSLIVAVICALHVCRGRPSETSETSETSHSSSFSDSVYAANGYRVSFSQQDQDGKCVSTLSIQGHGINKVITSTCQVHPPAVVNLNGTLLVGDEYYSDTPSVLVRVHGGRCEKEVFHEDQGKFTSKVEPLDGQECDRVRERVEKLKARQIKWDDWFKKQQENIEQQMKDMLKNLQNMHQQLIGGF